METIKIERIYKCRSCGLTFSVKHPWEFTEEEFDDFLFRMTTPSVEAHRRCLNFKVEGRYIGVGDLIGFRILEKRETK